jgi:Protein of unknown function (DUF3892)
MAPEHRIRALGGTRTDGTPWRLSEFEAISGIEQHRWVLHVEGPRGETVPVVVAVRAGKKYLKALDREMPELLLALPKCAPALAPSPGASERARSAGVL